MYAFHQRSKFMTVAQVWALQIAKRSQKVSQLFRRYTQIYSAIVDDPFAPDFDFTEHQEAWERLTLGYSPAWVAFADLCVVQQGPDEQASNRRTPV